MIDNGTVLVVGAPAATREAFERALRGRADALFVASSEEALATVRSLVPDVVVLDPFAAEASAFVAALRAQPHTSTTALVGLVARDALDDGETELGVDDVLLAPAGVREIRLRMSAQVRASRLRRQASSQNVRVAQIYEQAPMAIAMLRGADLVVESLNPHARALLGGRDLSGLRLRELLGAAPFVERLLEPVEEVYRTGDAYGAQGVEALVQREGSDAPEARWFDVSYQPFRGVDGQVEGVSCLAVDVSESMRVREGLAREVTERRRVEARASLLAEASRRLLEARNVEEAFEHVVETTVPAFARRAEVLVAQGAELVGLARRDASVRGDEVVGGDADVADVRLAAATGESVVLRAGGGVELFDPTLHVAAGDTLAPVLRMALPIEVAGFTLGVLRFVRGADEPPYGVDDVRLGEEIAQRVAIVVETSRLQHIERETRGRVERLQAVTAALSETATVEDAANVLVREAVEHFGADAAVVYALSADGRKLTAVARGGAEGAWFAPSVDAPSEAPAVGGLVDRSPVYLERMPGNVVAPFVACASLPLLGPGDATFGVVCAAFARPHCFPQSERTFFDAVARQSAVALERARLLDDERRARKEAEDAARVRDEFLATVSHELRTPLTAIVGWTSMLRDGERDDGSLERGIEVVDRNAKALTRIVEDILDVSRIITGNLRLEPEPFALEDVVREAVDTVRHAARAKRLHLALILSETPSRLVGDPARLRQVFWNLLTNAIRYTPAGGSIRASLTRLDDEIVVEVRDTGMGIEPAFLPHVWERFRQADGSTTRRHGGLGLGLSIVRHVVELHGGWVEVSSDGLGLGAAFRVHLYERRHATVAPPVERRVSEIVAVRRAPARALEGLSVLVVEDERDTRELIQSVLEGAGGDVRTASCAPEALGLLGERLPDLVVCDIGLPDVDGYALLGRARERFDALKHVPAVALTAFARREDAVRAREAGFLAHIAKPIEPAALVERLAALLGRSRDSVPIAVARPA